MLISQNFCELCSNVFQHAKFFIRFWFADYSTTKEMLFVLSKQRYLDRFLSLKIQMRCIHNFFCIKICINIQWCQLTLLYFVHTMVMYLKTKMWGWNLLIFEVIKKFWQKFEKIIAVGNTETYAEQIIVNFLVNIIFDKSFPIGFQIAFYCVGSF